MNTLKNTRILTDNEIEIFKSLLLKNGYDPDVAMGNLMTALKLTPDIAHMGNMPVGVANVIVEYTTTAKKLKDNWKAIKAGSMSVRDINFIIPEKRMNEKGKVKPISLDAAKDFLKQYYWQELRKQGFIK